MRAPNDVLQRNLALLRRIDPRLAQRVEQADPVALEWSQTRTGQWTASIDHHGRPIALASRYDPHKEAGALVGEIDYRKTACAVVLGFGLGYHAARVARDLNGRGVLIIYEPDVALLRAAFERIDQTDWMCKTVPIFADDQTDRAQLLQKLEGHASLITQGMKLIVHPASRQRHEEAFKSFGKTVTEVLAFCRTNVATALVNSARTCRNLAANLDLYAAGATTNELHHAAEGCPAVCVSAGPSLVRNADLLRDPAVRANVVVIAAQTALRPLLDRGVRPDFVTALDYSQACRRFYEQLPDLPDVTLVAEPKAHHTVFDNYPGPVRVCASIFNDELLGDLRRPITPIGSGATVAHLSFYVAQHLGCDPIIFIGQDLGFSDGLYYAPGTAVHQLWACEINPFNTMEMMEWKRIMGVKGNLRRAQDIHGRPIFTDEQMATYLKQFERDFAKAGQTILDATEGGLPKAHAQQVTLSEALRQYATRPVPQLPIPPRTLDRRRLDAVIELIRQRVREINDLRSTTRKTIPILRQMQEHQRDQQRLEKLYKQLRKHQIHVETDLRQAFVVVNNLNTVGTYKRARADRAIGFIEGDRFEKQSQQISRDIDNLDFLIQACDEALDIFEMALERATASAKKQGDAAVPRSTAKTKAAAA